MATFRRDYGIGSFSLCGRIEFAIVIIEYWHVTSLLTIKAFATRLPSESEDSSVLTD